MNTTRPVRTPGIQRAIDAVIFRGSVLRHCEAQFQAVVNYATVLERATSSLVQFLDPDSLLDQQTDVRLRESARDALAVVRAVLEGK